MQIKISDRRKINGIQEEFSAAFPYLKLEFFPKPNGREKAVSKKTPVSSDKTIGECRVNHNSGTITITPGMTVSDLADRFRNVYGLEVQLSRNSGKIWLETTLTESWTLEEQNNQGEALSRQFN